MICPYCETEQEQKEICNFCEADLSKPRPKKKQMLSEEEAYQPQPVLELYHTFDLLVMLKHLRSERSFYYRNMQILRKAPAEANISQEHNELGQEIYREYTARVRVIENILIDRLGYKPKRVDDKLLYALEMKMKRA